MADPIRFLVDWPGARGRRALPTTSQSQVIRRDPLYYSADVICRNELRLWFEPKWRDGLWLAKRYRHCTIYSIPEESDTFNLRRVPAWRKRPSIGVV